MLVIPQRKKNCIGGKVEPGHRTKRKQLRERHGLAYSGIQFTVWAATIAAENHESLDNPPTGILNFGSRPRGRSSNFEEALQMLLAS